MKTATPALPLPSPEAYELKQTAIIISSIIGTAGSILVFLGTVYLVIILTRKIAKRLAT